MALKSILLAGLILLAPAVGASSERRVPTISVSDILRDPTTYAGKSVRIHGFAFFEFEGHAIWHDEAAFRNNRFRQSLWIDTRGLTEPQMQAVSGRSVFITGTFNPARKGHLSLFPGAIEHVVALNSDPSDTLPARGRTDPQFLFLLALLACGMAIAALLSLGVLARRAALAPFR